MSEQVTISRELYNKLIADQRRLTDILPELDKAEECGIDCQAYRQLHKEALEQNMKLVEKYKPGK